MPGAVIDSHLQLALAGHVPTPHPFHTSLEELLVRGINTCLDLYAHQICAIDVWSSHVCWTTPPPFDGEEAGLTVKSRARKYVHICMDACDILGQS